MACHVSVPEKEIAEFCGRYHVRQIQLFGSALRDDFGPESDLDVLVDFEPEAQIGFLTLGRMRRELEQLLQRPVDLIPREGLKPRIREAVLSSAEVIYAA